MVVAVAVGAFGNLLEVVVAELSKEARIALVSKVLFGDILFEPNGHIHPKSSPVRQPSHPARELLMIQNICTHLWKKG